MTPEQQALADKLTNLQRGVVLGVVAGKTQRQAYRDAGGKAKTDETADASASEILSHPEVKAFYDSLVSNAATDAVMTRSEALERLSLMGRTRITDIVEFETVEVSAVDPKTGEDVKKTETIWRIKESAELNELAASAIKSVTMTKFGPKIEMHDAASAIAQMSKMQGWDAPNKVQVSGDPDNPVVSVTLGKEEYKAARAEMLKNDDC